MYPDFFYNYLNIGLPWIAIAIGYASFDYFYNLIMCSILGGVIQINKFNINSKNRARKLFTKYYFTEIKRNYKIGSRKLLKEFYKDKLSWSWPLTSLALPTLLYGLTRKLAVDGVLSLTTNGINVDNFNLLPSNIWVQFFLWGFALILSLRTFYRYHKERSKPTWFSRIWFFSFSRVLLFNFPLSYMVLSIIYIWAQYSTSLFLILSSNQIQYTIFHPDLMYGLGKVYNSVVTMGVFLIILSLLPALMLIREKREKYNKMYYILIYGGIITLFFLLSSLIIKFDQRLGNIREFALNSIQTKIQIGIPASIETISNLEYFSLISNLPGRFPMPALLSFLLSARSIALFFEIMKIISHSTSNSNLFKLLQKILENKT
jgi:hypothetical protein